MANDFICCSAQALVLSVIAPSANARARLAMVTGAVLKLARAAQPQTSGALLT